MARPVGRLKSKNIFGFAHLNASLHVESMRHVPFVVLTLLVFVFFSFCSFVFTSKDLWGLAIKQHQHFLHSCIISTTCGYQQLLFYFSLQNDSGSLEFDPPLLLYNNNKKKNSNHTHAGCCSHTSLDNSKVQLDISFSAVF